MKWRKRGLIYAPAGHKKWARHTASQPTAILCGKDVIRVFIGCRDDEGITRIGYVDVKADDPSQVVNVSQDPVLDVGRAGAASPIEAASGDEPFREGSVAVEVPVGAEAPGEWAADAPAADDASTVPEAVAGEDGGGGDAPSEDDGDDAVLVEKLG